MIPICLQDTLVNELKQALSNYKLKNTLNDLVQLNIYPQSLPAKEDDNDKNHFPYVLVRIQDGSEDNENDPALCRVIFIIGCYDDNENYQGHRDVLNTIDKLKEHLLKKKVFENKYSITYPFSWSLNEEDTYPFYFGGIETNWEIGKVIQKEDEYV